MIAVFKFVNDICLNPREYLLDSPNGSEIIFDTKDDAIAFLHAFDDSIQCEDDLNEQGIYIDDEYEYTLDA